MAYGKKATNRRSHSFAGFARGHIELEQPEQFSNRISPRGVLADQKGLFALSFFFGAFVNLLVFTGPIFALQVYDRVLRSQSEETLLVLSLLMVFLFVVMGVLDHTRKRISSRIGERFVSQLERPVFQTVSANRFPKGGPGLVQDMETIRQFFTSPLFVALGDVIWVPVFILGLTVLHPTLGWLCMAGGLAFMIPGIWNLVIQDSARPDEQPDYQTAESLLKMVGAQADQAHGIFPVSGVLPHWKHLRHRARARALSAQDLRAGMASAAQTFRTLLQSLTIAVGALLVLQDQLTPGAIIAATVLLARALGPLDLISQNTPALRGLLGSWRRLSRTIGPPRQAPATLRVVPPQLRVNQVTVFPPDQRKATLRMVDFDLGPGTALGVLGPSGSGKSTLARTIAGIWPAAGGTLVVGTSPIGRLGQEDRSRNIGYLPQTIRFQNGTIGQNISGFEAGNSRDKVISAARRTNSHDPITSLPEGYDTVFDPDNPPFAGGVLQSIALARAIYHSPPIVVLDEPGNNMDQGGHKMLERVIDEIKTSGRIALVLSQNPKVLKGCDQILTLQSGVQVSFGPTAGNIGMPTRMRGQGFPVPIGKVTP